MIRRRSATLSAMMHFFFTPPASVVPFVRCVITGLFSPTFITEEIQTRPHFDAICFFGFGFFAGFYCAITSRFVLLNMGDIKWWDMDQEAVFAGQEKLENVRGCSCPLLLKIFPRLLKCAQRLRLSNCID